MTNNIVGKSKENKKATGMIESIGDIGVSIQRIANQLGNHETRISSVEDTMRVNGIQEKNLTDNVNRIVVRHLGGKESNAYADKSIRGRTYSQINKEIKNKFGVPRRGELPAKEYDYAMILIDNWRPDYELKAEISYSNNQLALMNN